jgi:STAS-like domain of unknown function (DUF4325)
MTKSIGISTFSKLNLLGTRFIAKKIRTSIEDALSPLDNVEVDFSHVEVTQSFIDELLGPLLLRRGPQLLTQLAFRGCSENAQVVIRFVVTARLSEFAESQSLPAENLTDSRVQA